MPYEDEVLPLIGDPIPDPHPSVFLLVVEDHVDYVNPRSFSLHKVPQINPASYFVTSGDAVEKAKVLEKDLWHLAGELRKQSYTIIEKEHNVTASKAQQLYRTGTRPSKPKKFHLYEEAMWKSAGQARKLLNALKKAKGVNCFLETEWDSHRLLCIPKNPRTPRSN
jgi:hypothetical protein